MSADPVAAPAQTAVAAAQTYVTHDIDAARDFLSGQFMGHVPTVRGPFADFRMRVRSVDHGPFVRYDLAHRSTVESANEPYAGFLIGRVLDGRVRFQLGHDDVRVGPGELYLYPQGIDLVSTWESTSVDDVVLAPEAMVEAGASLGLTGPPLLDATRPVDPELVRQWQRTTDYVDQVSASIDLSAYPLIAHQLSRLLAAVVLTIYPQRAALDLPGEGRAGSAVLRRALAYVEDHADEPVGLVELASAAGVGPRALQQAFRRQLDTTPTEYARRVRLDRAYRDLVAGDPSRGDTVADIAARWGFVHLGRFAAEVRAAYGRSPRTVLHG
jgi:AraC-like DNA-binding protein